MNIPSKRLSAVVNTFAQQEEAGSIGVASGRGCGVARQRETLLP